MPRQAANRTQLLESPGRTPLHERGHYADWLAQSLVAEHFRAEELMGFSGPTGPYGEAGNLPPAVEYLPSERTAFYSLATDSDVINPKAAELKDVAHRLVGTGLADERTLEGLSFRLTNLKEPTPAWLQQAEADHVRYNPVAENLITRNEGSHPNLQNSSYSVLNLLNVDEAQAAQFSVESVDRTTAVFLHELAHAQHAPFGEEFKHELSEALRGAQAWREGEPALLAAASEIMEQERPLVAFFEKNDWNRVAGEAYADAYMVVAVHALHGKEAALQTLDSLQQNRTGHMVEMLDKAPMNLYFAEGHHTSESLEALRGLIEDGSVGRALKEGRGRDPALMATAEGLIREFESVRTADLNPHTLDAAGELYRGWPAELPSSGAVLQAIQEEWGEVKFGAMVVVTDKQYAQMQAQGEHLRAVSDAGQAQEMEAHSLPGAPGYVVMLTDSLTLERENADGVQQYELQSGAHNLRDDLAERYGVELPGEQRGFEDSHSSGSVSMSAGVSGGGLGEGTEQVSAREREDQGAQREERAAQAEAQAEAEMEM